MAVGRDKGDGFNRGIDEEAAIFGRGLAFRSRTPERDRATDLRRLEQIDALVTDLALAVRAEAEGLRTRYYATRRDASMVLMQVEGEGSEGKANPKLDNLDQAMMYCETRTRELERQRALLERLAAMVSDEVQARTAR